MGPTLAQIPGLVHSPHPEPMKLADVVVLDRMEIPYDLPSEPRSAWPVQRLRNLSAWPPIDDVAARDLCRFGTAAAERVRGGIPSRC